MGVEGAAFVAFDESRVDVVVPTDCRRVAEKLRRLADDLADKAFAGRLRGQVSGGEEPAGGLSRGLPRAEILGGDCLAGEFLQVFVDIAGLHGPDNVVAVEALKEPTALER